MVDFSKAIGAEFRQVVDREHGGRPARAVIAERTYDTDAADLWDALTSQTRIARWFAPVDGDLRLGGRYQVQGNAGGTITRCDAPEAFDLTWEFMGGMSWVNVRLTAQGERTRLTLEHIVGLADVPDEHWQKYGPGAVGVGWELGLLGLGLHIGSSWGSADDRAAYEFWAATDEGKGLIRGMARGWGQAHIAGGENPETARGMAERTAAAYAPE